MKFVDYSTYLLESETFDNLKYYYIWKQMAQVLQIVLISDDAAIGYINPWLYENDTWEIVAIAAEPGYGYKMHEAAMDFLYPDWIMPVRNKAINPALIKTYTKFIDRPDIETEKIEPNDSNYVKIDNQYDDWFNRRYRLKKNIGIQFEKADYGFMQRTGVKLFNNKYSYVGKSKIDEIFHNK